MSETAPLISDLALILVIAGIVTLIFKKLNQPIILGRIPHLALFSLDAERIGSGEYRDLGGNRYYLPPVCHGT